MTTAPTLSPPTSAIEIPPHPYSAIKPGLRCQHVRAALASIRTVMDRPRTARSGDRSALINGHQPRSCRRPEPDPLLPHTADVSVASERVV